MGARQMSSVPSTMKAAVIRETGPASVMKVETDYPVPEIVDGQVLVKNEYAGINFIDTYHRSGLYVRCTAHSCKALLEPPMQCAKVTLGTGGSPANDLGAPSFQMLHTADTETSFTVQHYHDFYVRARTHARTHALVSACYSIPMRRCMLAVTM